MSTTQQKKNKQSKAKAPVQQVEELDDVYDYDDYDDDEEDQNRQDQQLVQQKAISRAVSQPQYGAASRQDIIPPRAEGYRRAVVRESRIKDRPYKPVGDSSLRIKIELDLEVEASYFRLPQQLEVILGYLLTDVN